MNRWCSSAISRNRPLHQCRLQVVRLSHALGNTNLPDSSVHAWQSSFLNRIATVDNFTLVFLDDFTLVFLDDFTLIFWDDFTLVFLDDFTLVFLYDLILEFLDYFTMVFLDYSTLVSLDYLTLVLRMILSRFFYSVPWYI